MRKYKPASPEKKKIALKEMKEYLSKAESYFSKDKVMAAKYVQKARRSGMRYKVSFPKTLKKKFCKHCHSYLKQGVNVTVRTNKSNVVYTCKECKGVMRFGYN
tara:strand:- start:178 stop:486 length:309 start_codon:yes stop_codon:yes gene_type:complete